MKKILIATNNPAKVREIHAVLATGDQRAPVVQWSSLSDLSIHVPEPEETGATFVQNATLKATYYARLSGLLALADDSGLEVDALHGEPGVHSAYFDRSAAHLPRPQRDAANNAKLVAAVRGIPIERRTARYHCVMVLAGEAHGVSGVLATAHGIFEGLILDQPRGQSGFGYDPYFLVPELEKTVAELSAEHKNRISHRGKALRAMREKILGLLGSSR
jgi:XTP/dITP diphosphohydrolase